MFLLCLFLVDGVYFFNVNISMSVCFFFLFCPIFCNISLHLAIKILSIY